MKRFREQAENNQNSRIENLFSKLGLQDYFLDESGLSVIPTLPGIDYNLVKERMSIERERSLSYLKKFVRKIICERFALKSCVWVAFHA